jgi:hypothetical protein
MSQYFITHYKILLQTALGGVQMQRNIPVIDGKYLKRDCPQKNIRQVKNIDWIIKKEAGKEGR